MLTNTTEKGLEDLIVHHLVTENGFEQGENSDYNKEYALDETRILRFLETTQKSSFEQLQLGTNPKKKTEFLDRLSKEIANRGVVDVLRNGVKAYPAPNVIVFYMTPSEKNQQAKEQFQSNIFSVTRQLLYSSVNSHLALDLALFINGLPVITCELKNQLTKQNVEDAVYQYKTDRDPKELLFSFKRCMVHFAVDDVAVKFCTKLARKNSWFLPFNKGVNGGAGNPVNPHGLKTDYLWKDIFTKLELANIIENYAQVVETTDPDSKKKSSTQIFPRYHQLALVKSLLSDVKEQGVGKRYLIQHSAGSGKSNSIAWLAHQLIGLEKDGENLVDSVIVVTDRVNLDKQIRDTIKQFMQVSSTVEWAKNSGDLKKFLQGGKKIIITTIHKFPFILADMGTSHKENRFAILIDEAHSSQSGSMSAKMNMALSAIEETDDRSTEDILNDLAEGRKLVQNASYFAFTATPKQKTLELFGNETTNVEGESDFLPYHNYSMKQAIQEGFIMDVLSNYMPVNSYYKLAKIIDDNPIFDNNKAQKKLRAFVEGDSDAIAHKAGIMVEHFHEQVLNQGKLGGKARSMVVTSSILRAIEYYFAINKHLADRNSEYKTIIAFSGEKVYQGKMLTESSLNGFPSADIEKKLKKDPYRILIVADKFQTGYDEPLLHTMYVDKMLGSIKTVQTLSRLNRAHPEKNDTCVLDFANDPDKIQEDFSQYYTTTMLSGSTDPNRLYDLLSVLENYQIYTQYHVNEFVELFLHGETREKLDPILDICVTLYEDLDEKGQVEFKSTSKAFVRTYGFLGAILPVNNTEWEKTSIFLTFLTPKLPAPIDEDLAEGILESIDLDSYRAEKMHILSLLLTDETAVLENTIFNTGGGKQEPDMELLSNILDIFNDLFGNIPWKDEDKMKQQILEIPDLVYKDEKFKNAIHYSDKENARIEGDRALKQVISNLMIDNMELFKHFSDNESFNKWISDYVFDSIYSRKRKELD